MKDSTKGLVQQFMAALWTAASAHATTPVGERIVGLVELVNEAEAQLAGLRLHLLHEAGLVAGARVVDQVRSSTRTTPAQATATLRLATDLGERFELIGAALSEGGISLAQAEAIVAGMKKLPTRLTRTELVECQQLILAHTNTLGPAELRVLAAHLSEVIDPDQADTDDATRLAREERAAHRDRFLRLAPDHHGSIRITGQLRVADAELLSAQLDALMPAASTYQHTGQAPNRDARRADALVLLTHTVAKSSTLPTHGGNRPQVHITVNLDTLTTGLGAISLLGTFGTDGVDGLSAGEARRLACDAHLIPIVLGTPSRPLDVGRTHRLFTPAIRTALTLRDQGCAFPGCTAGPTASEAHHITPWWAGGDTTLTNAVLLCPHHHRLTEPDPQQSAESQWQVHLDEATGTPWFTPPRHIDPTRRPRQHQHHHLQQLRPHTPAPPCPHEAQQPDPAYPEQSRLPAYTGPDLDELIRLSAAVWAQ